MNHPAFIAVARDGSTSTVYDVFFWHDEEEAYERLFIDGLEDWQFGILRDRGVFDIVAEDLLAVTVEKEAERDDIRFYPDPIPWGTGSPPHPYQYGTADPIWYNTWHNTGSSGGHECPIHQVA